MNAPKKFMAAKRVFTDRKMDGKEYDLETIKNNKYGNTKTSR
jgi:hypothetical protein